MVVSQGWSPHGKASLVLFGLLFLVFVVVVVVDTLCCCLFCVSAIMNCCVLEFLLYALHDSFAQV